MHVYNGVFTSLGLVCVEEYPTEYKTPFYRKSAMHRPLIKLMVTSLILVK